MAMTKPDHICLDRYILDNVYMIRELQLCHCRGAEQASHPQPAALVRTLGGRARARASTVAAVGFQAPASAAGCGVRRIAHRSAASSLSLETGAAHGARRMAA